MKTSHWAILLGGVAFLAGCSEEPKPRSVAEFVENPIVLEAAVVRCAQNRDKTRYDAECVNARQAVSIVEAKEERERAKAFEAQSERKRKSLRRTQQAAAEARRRAQEAERKRREAEYLAQFGELPPPEEVAGDIADPAGNAPAVVMPEPGDGSATGSARNETVPAADGGNAPAHEQEAPADLNEIREELQRRNEETGN
jgi:hypothetical protein